MKKKGKEKKREKKEKNGEGMEKVKNRTLAKPAYGLICFDASKKKEEKLQLGAERHHKVSSSLSLDL